METLVVLARMSAGAASSVPPMKLQTASKSRAILESGTEGRQLAIGTVPIAMVQAIFPPMAVAQEPFPAEAIRALKRSEYERLAEMGAFADEKVELLYGRIVKMSPQGSAHSFGITRLNELLVMQLAGRAVVRVQMPFAASPESMPEPDVAVVPVGNYLDAHPGAAHLVVEVADASLAIDRAKASLYAQAAVTEYWIVDVRGGSVEVHRRPKGGAYADVQRLVRGQTLAVPGFADVVVPVAAILPPE